MSTALTTLGGQKASSLFAQLAPESLAEGIGSSYGVVGYKGKTLSLRYKGNVYPVLRPDDGTPASYIDVIILRQAKSKSKSYYEGGYVPGQSDGKPPTCASMDGVAPDDGVTAKQADSCVLCAHNVWKQDATGRRGRDCSDYKRLSVMLMPNVTAKMLGAPLLEPVFLRIPPASLNALSMFGEAMAAQGYHFASFITRITFDPLKAHPEFVFAALQVLGDDEARVVLPLITDPQSVRIVGEDVARTALPAPAARPQLAAPVAQPVAPVVVAPAVVQAPAPVIVQPVVVAPPPPPPAQSAFAAVVPPASPAPPPPPAPGGMFGGVAVAPPPAQAAPVQPAAPVVGQSVADTGAPQIADDALNARIANILKR